MHEIQKSMNKFVENFCHKEKITYLHMRSAFGILLEKIREAKIFGMKVAFKWNNKCVQVKNTTGRQNNHRIKFLGKRNSKKKYQLCTRHLCLVFSTTRQSFLVFPNTRQSCLVFSNTRHKQFSLFQYETQTVQYFSIPDTTSSVLNAVSFNC